MGDANMGDISSGGVQLLLDSRNGEGEGDLDTWCSGINRLSGEPIGVEVWLPPAVRLLGTHMGEVAGRTQIEKNIIVVLVLVLWTDDHEFELEFFRLYMYSTCMRK